MTAEFTPPVGIVTSASRRWVQICTPEWEALRGTVSSKALEVTVGDEVEYEVRNGETFVTAVRTPRNSLSRSYQGRHKNIARNLDHLCLVAAATPLFNTVFLDRVMAVAQLQKIPFSLVVNKADLSFEDIESLLEVYRDLGVSVLHTSAHRGDGIASLEDLLQRPELKIVAFAGVSGVGKSSLLNKLIPGAIQDTAEVSHRTGQGRRTTSLALAYRYDRPPHSPLLLVDLPGVHNFGVEHLAKEILADLFPEFVRLRGKCQFLNCLHTMEPDCAVKEAVEDGLIAPSRYESYIGMLVEVEDSRKY